MAIDADGNFYNPYSPGTYEYEMEEGTRGQEPSGLTAEQFAAQQKELEPIVKALYPEQPKSNFFGQILGPILAVASLAIPGIGEVIGAAILGESAATVGAAVGLTEIQVSAAVGASALSAATTAASGGSVEDVIKNAASAGIASGLNVGVGGGVPGAVAGSAAGTLIKGGDVSQIVSNVIAAGVGAGIQDVSTNPDAGKIIGTAARTYIASGGNLDQTLLNTAASAIGTLDQPAKTAQQLQAASTPAKASQDLIEPFEQGGLKYEEQPDGTAKVTDQAGNEKTISYREFSKILNADPSAQAAPSPTPTDATALAPQTVVAPSPVVSPVVTDLDLVKQVAAQPTPAVDPKALERVIVQGQGANVANVAPVSTEITTPRPDTTRGLAPVEVLGKYEQLPEPGFEEYKLLPEQKKAEVVTDVPSTALEPVEISGKYEQLPEPGFEAYQPLPPKLEGVTVQGYTEKPAEVVTDVPPSRSLAPVEVVGKAEQLPEPGFEEYKPLPEPKVSDVVTDVAAAPTAPAAPEVKTEEPKKEEPAKETKKLYPTVTSVPRTSPTRQPIISGVSPARLLADALAAYRPAGAIEGEESGKERQNVWNEKSLRLKDALGL